MPVTQKSLNEVRAYEACTSSNEIRAFGFIHLNYLFLFIN